MTHKTFILFVLGLATLACTRPNIEPCTDEESLHTFSSFPIGVSVTNTELRYNTRYREIAIQQFNSITPGNMFKPVNLHPYPQFYFWENADHLVNFCNTNNQRLHGHTLIWHSQLPNWMNNFQGSKKEWEDMFKDHIQTIVRHFKGQVTGWDVINEAFNDNGTLRNTIWKEHIGSSYIEKAFIYAHEADPDALLFYNDYDIALNETKRKAILNFLNNLRLRGIPIHGIGLQMHISTQHPEEIQITNALNEISRENYLIHLSEIDVSVNILGKDIEPSLELFNRQAEKLGKLLLAYKTVPSHLQYGMTFWGVSDGTSWIRSFFNRMDYPLLFDDDYQPKPAYCKFKSLL